jgi:large subunit ribosomal protein L9
MKVILIEDVDDLGAAGDIVNVKDGYARNYLIPNKLGMLATDQNLQRLGEMRKRREVLQTKARTAAERIAQRIESISLTMARKAGESEKLFGSVTSMDIERALREEGIEVDRKKILLEEPIKSLGIYQVPIKVHPDTTASLKVWVVHE